MRLFVGLPVAPLPSLDAAVEELARLAPSARPVAPGKRHATLRFLGEVADPQPVEAALRAGVAGAPALRGDLEGVGAFPEARHARVAWAGIAAPGLDTLAARVREATAGMGQPETRPFAPHVTLARLPRPRDLVGWCARHAGCAWGPFAADAVVLYESRPGEGAYREVARVSLRPQA